ncbi:PLC-like phosphodiesterase [Lindgomyces ingoldianus]|uniref:PLC-like phosphodiesterase n=1 Tax=Lindgomyces ingoldianus TaxID=673940 RepID=A0ACB6QYN1_9PLEO|nr:PLC-like phosphodiesterase [Lindgomyces ingoldianus]KAF2471902.1 PLC-like phosphodiesterase [Lindgomyces ingoldianus]
MTISEPAGSFNTTASSSTLTSRSLIGITGVPVPSLIPNATTTAFSLARPQAPNSQPCNNYVEFCNRRLSNISLVVAHNSPFVVPHNVASNQDRRVSLQLEDGIRGLQFETHMPNGTLRLCHTSCDLLDAGTLEDYLHTVASWLVSHPYEIIAIMMGNDGRVAPTSYVAPFTNAGLISYLYTPLYPNLTLDQWPTLEEMILQNKRVVVMLDYLANQTEVPWLLDQFAYQWQTPFSPVDSSFPCTQQRPPNEAEDISRNKMYMINHNLNIPIALEAGDASILIPAYTLLNELNAVEGNGSLGQNVKKCTAMWGRPPNWLLVDYYNFGNFNGSVFEVAAAANNVTYNRKCCGTETTSGVKSREFTLNQTYLLAIIAAVSVYAMSLSRV